MQRVVIDQNKQILKRANYTNKLQCGFQLKMATTLHKFKTFCVLNATGKQKAL